MRNSQIKKLTELLLKAYAQGITNAVDLAEYLANNGVCFKKDVLRRYQAIWDED